MVESHARSHHEDKAGVTEQELFAAARRMIHDYLTGRLPRADAAIWSTSLSTCWNGAIPTLTESIASTWKF